MQPVTLQGRVLQVSLARLREPNEMDHSTNKRHAGQQGGDAPTTDQASRIRPARPHVPSNTLCIQYFGVTSNAEVTRLRLNLQKLPGYRSMRSSESSFPLNFCANLEQYLVDFRGCLRHNCVRRV